MKPTLRYNYLGGMPFDEAYALQASLAQRLQHNQDEKGYLLLLHHPPTITSGRRGTEQFIHLNEVELKEQGLDFFETDRGGLVTYHGPGQLVGYPVLHLSRLGIKTIPEYVAKLEEVMIKTCRIFGIYAEPEEGLRGVWVGRDKIGAIGVHVRGKIATHGFSLNINPDLSHYQWITPCGLKERGVTSMEKIGIHASLPTVAKALVRVFQEVFGVRLLKEELGRPSSRLSSHQR